ncbi:hypothetical protein TNCV_132251 [Trichonephila clavipes]|nr:hypothetical protein TNCV_132251 [Trichonephila clavipes]
MKYKLEKNRKHTIQTEEYRHLLQMMIPAYNRRGALLSIRDGNPLQVKIGFFFLEEETTMPYSRFKPEHTRLQAVGHVPHTGWVAPIDGRPERFIQQTSKFQSQFFGIRFLFPSLRG